jgi:hypothetical protein
VVIVKIRNLRARCLEPNSNVPYVLHEVEYQVESLLREGLWIDQSHTMYATDPIDAITKAKLCIDEPSVVKHAY